MGFGCTICGAYLPDERSHVAGWRRYTGAMIQIPMTEEEFAATAARLEQQQGIKLDGTEGKITKMGVTAGYQYLEGLLRVTILDKPFFVTTEYCEEQLKNWLAG